MSKAKALRASLLAELQALQSLVHAQQAEAKEAAALNAALGKALKKSSSSSSTSTTTNTTSSASAHPSASSAAAAAAARKSHAGASASASAAALGPAERLRVLGAELQLLEEHAVFYRALAGWTCFEVELDAGQRAREARRARIIGGASLAGAGGGAGGPAEEEEGGNGADGAEGGGAVGERGGGGDVHKQSLGLGVRIDTFAQSTFHEAFYLIFAHRSQSLHSHPHSHSNTSGSAGSTPTPLPLPTLLHATLPHPTAPRAR